MFVFVDFYLFLSNFNRAYIVCAPAHAGRTHCVNRPFALESVSRRETAVQGQTAATHVRCVLLKTNKTKHFLI